MKTFPQYEPRFGLNPSKRFTINEVKFGDGYSQRSRQGINNADETWPLTYSLPDRDCELLAEFLDEHQGFKAFLWTPPAKTQGKYICKSYTGPRRIGLSHSTIRCTFERVYDA